MKAYGTLTDGFVSGERAFAIRINNTLNEEGRQAAASRHQRATPMCPPYCLPMMSPKAARTLPLGSFEEALTCTHFAWSAVPDALDWLPEIQQPKLFKVQGGTRSARASTVRHRVTATSCPSRVPLSASAGTFSFGVLPWALCSPYPSLASRWRSERSSLSSLSVYGHWPIAVSSPAAC